MTDDRIPLRFAAAVEAGPHEVLLVEAAAAAGPTGAAMVRFQAAGARHGAGCVCCAGRGAAAAALGALFQARALGQVFWFTGVVAVVADPAAVAAEVQGDRVAAARFRIVA